MSGWREYGTDDTLRNTLTVEVCEEVDMMEVWCECERSIDQGWSGEPWCVARTLKEKGAVFADLLSSVGLSDGCTIRGGVQSVIVICYLLGGHVTRGGME